MAKNDSIVSNNSEHISTPKRSNRDCMGDDMDVTSLNNAHFNFSFDEEADIFRGQERQMRPIPDRKR